MRPLSLQITAFGPYPGVQEIDFEALAGSDLFLVHGPTGSGKTSIFDALTYALFGELAGSRKVDRIRADRAAPDLPTRVVLRFRMGEAVYVVERSPEWQRPKKRGQGFTSEPATASLAREGEGKALATQSTAVTDAVEELLGMDVDQFTQVALLPQGEFRKILLAETKDREPLLQQLFATGRFKQIEELLQDRKRALRERYESLATRRSEALGGETPAAVQARLVETRERSGQATTQAADAAARDGLAERALSDARALAKRFDELDDARAGEARTRVEAEAAEGDRARLARARKAEHARALLEAARTARGEEERCLREERAGVAARSAAGEEVEKAERALAAATAEEPARDAQRARIHALEAALPEVERLRRLEDSFAASGRKLAAAAVALEKAGGAVEGALAGRDTLAAERERLRPVAGELPARTDAARLLAEALRIAAERDGFAKSVARLEVELDRARRMAANKREAAGKAQATAQELHALREERLAASVARGLEEGKPCPVCGSTHHPSPAVAEGHVPDEAEVTGAREVAEGLRASAGELESSRDLEAERLETARRSLAEAAGRESRPAEDLAVLHARAVKSRDEAQAAQARLSGLERELTEAESRIESARGGQEEARRAESEARTEHAKVEASREELRRRLASVGAGTGTVAEVGKLRAALAASEGRARAAEEACTGARTRAAQAATACEHLVRTRELAAAAHATARAGAEAACTEQGFASPVDCAAALVAPADQERLQASIDERVARHGAARTHLGELEGALAGVERPDVAGLEAARATSRNASRLAEEARVRLEEEVAQVERTLERAANLQAEGEAVESALAVQGHVADLVRGTNARGMSLHRFVLAALLEEVAQAASERLTVMTHGRFRLRHDDSLARKNAAAGLSLVVEDTHTGTIDRPVGALSGGESFLASLALALGLSDVVLRHSGGRRLDSLFIDEGFGTLDEATLDDALQALETLRQAGRMVGVISHVPELRRRIPARIEVTTGEGGAVATVHPA